jgi:hypothetical protein
MNEAPRTYRNTVALVLTMCGGMTWAIFPVGVLSVERVHTPQVAALATLALGCLLGAGLATSADRAIAWWSAAAAGALYGALFAGASGYAETGVIPALDAFAIIAVLAAAGAAAAGAWLGARTRRRHVAPAAAVIALGAPVAVATLLGLLGAAGMRPDPVVTVVLVLTSPLLGGAAGALLHRQVTGKELGRWLLRYVGLTVAVLSFGASDENASVTLVLVSALVGAFVAVAMAIMSVVGLLAVRAWQRPPAAVEVPTARVVDR